MIAFYFIVACILSAAIGVLVTLLWRPKPEPRKPFILRPGADYDISDIKNMSRVQVLQDQSAAGRDAQEMLEKLRPTLAMQQQSAMVNLTEIDKVLTNPAHKVIFYAGWMAAMRELTDGLASAVTGGKVAEEELRGRTLTESIKDEVVR